MKTSLIALFLVAACSKGSKPEPAPAPAAKPAAETAAKPAAEPAAPAPAPAPTAQPARATQPATSAAPKLELFDAGKRGVVELVAIDDLSGRTKGTFKVVRHCGAAAVAAVDAIDKKIAERAKDGMHDPLRCTETGAKQECVQAGTGEGDTGIEILFDSGNLVGIQTYAMGITMDAQQKQFDKLLAGSCK